MLRLSTIFLLSSALIHATPYGVSMDEPVSPLPENIPVVRGFPTWEVLQPTEKTWNHAPADRLVADANQRGTRIVGRLHQLAPWSTPKNHPQGFPLPDLTAWENYTSSVVGRYNKDILDWDVLDSFNLGSLQTNTPFHYAQLLQSARKAARKANPEARIGLVLANYDLAFLDSTLRDGAAGNFDYLSLSPYHFTIASGEDFPTVLTTVRNLLESHDHDSAIPIHITLSGSKDELAIAAPLAAEAGFDEIFLDIDPSQLSEIPEKTASQLPAQPSHGDSNTVSLVFGKKNTAHGLFQIQPSVTPWDEKQQALRLPVSATPPVLHADFFCDSSFLSPDTRELEITVLAKRIPSDSGQSNPTGIGLKYESIYEIRTAGEWWSVPGDNKWHSHTWKIKDAKFVGKLGWHFRLDAAGAGNDVLLKEVRVSK
ncbi:endo-1,4-beta-xylanase [Luteolibacter algae]|uniref:Endo-1,4-beta-xylanase n=1 Tax=Luteolibacter algae TaxID=454151 RepID=A0ABW5D5G4_9BACT